MPETIVPQAQAIRAEAERLFMQPAPVMQSIHRLPKHYPVKEIEALLLAVMQFAREAEVIGRLWDQQEEADRLRWEALCDGWELEEDGRVFMETCAAEHSFRDILA